MKKIFFISVVSFLLFSCEKPGDCIKSTGQMVTKEIPATPFDVIYVYAGIGLVVKEGPEYKVEIRSGENLIDDISAVFQENVLTFRDNTTCNWVRDYGETTVFITAPNIVEIHSRTYQEYRKRQNRFSFHSYHAGSGSHLRPCDYYQSRKNCDG